MQHLAKLYVRGVRADVERGVVNIRQGVCGGSFRSASKGDRCPW